MELEQVSFTLPQLVEGQADVLIGKAKEKGLSLMTYIATDLPNAFIGDPGRLAQILLNLTGNAVKFTKTGGVTIKVRASKYQTYGESHRLVRFEVQDTGIGLSESAQKKLFQPFVQAEESISRKFGGTGLGLSICKRLVEMMGGDIGVDSVPGVGSTFWFEIPLKLSPEEGAKKPDRHFSKSPKILIADDDMLAQNVLTSYIDSWGMTKARGVLFADAVAAVTYGTTTKQPYDIVLIGRGINSDKGIQLARRIKELILENPPKLILMNELACSIDKGIVDEAGFMHVINKPVKQSSLFDAIALAVNDKVALKDAPTLAPSTPAPKQVQHSGRILIADDIQANQLVAVRMLESLGYTVHATANGIEVLEALSRVPYDLILMDCQMPEMDGFEATKAIRALADERLKNIPIVALTANAMAGDDKKCIQAGMNDYLSKPLKKANLKAMLEKWLGAASSGNNAA